MDVLEKFVNQKFNGITITAIKEQYEIDGRRADLAVLKDDGRPILLIETKKKYERGGYRAEKLFIPTSEHVVGQVVAYAALLKKSDVYVPWVATANDKQLALFVVSEKIEGLVNWKAINERRYDEVIVKFYDFRDKHLLFIRRHNNFSEEFFKELLDTITGIYVKEYGLEEKRQEPHWSLIEEFRDFVDLLAQHVQGAIAPDGKFREDIKKAVEEHTRRTGYSPPPEALAREMAYVLMNKIIFYKVLERYYKLPELKPAYREGLVNTCSSYLKGLTGLFEEAIKASKDFAAIFRTGIYDLIDFVESEEVLKALDWLIGLLDYYQVEKLGDLIGFIYEELIPGGERHDLGQFYTPKPIAELIVKWCIRSPDDKVLDPGCGSGTFLVEAYKRLAELKLKKPFKDVRHVPEEVHEQILRQLYGVDINEFPAHLTAMNLAMRNPRTPSTIMNIFVSDYFTIKPNQSLIAPYTIRTPEGEEQAKVVFKDFDAVVGNPPYTRWKEIPEEVRGRILSLYGKVMRDYRLHRFITGGALPGIFIPWIMHSARFLKDGGRLGMIISDSWLQTDYGIGFMKYLADNFKIRAIIDISTRIFPVPLIGTCIILLEKCSSDVERDSNMISLMFIGAEKRFDVDTIIKTIEDAKRETIVRGRGLFVNVVKQHELRNINSKPITLFFKVESILQLIKSTGKVVRLGDVFQPSEGNTIWSVYASMKGRGAGVGGEDFYYIPESKAKEYNLGKYVGSYLRPLISSPDRLKCFVFTEEDWSEKKEFILIANEPFTQLPPEVQEYVKLGESKIVIAKGPNRGKPASKSSVAEIRKKLGKVEVLDRTVTIYGWYDLGGVVEAPIYVTYGSQYWMRFVLAKHQCALDHRVLALIPRQGVEFDEVELKALLAYLNSSFAQLQAEVMGRSTGGGMIELDVKPLSDFLILDVKKLPKEDVEKLAELFDELEAEARRLGGAHEAENVLGSELARELTNRSVKSGIAGLFNTIIKRIDHEVARVLELEDIVEGLRTAVLEMAGRRLSRAQEAKREAIKGSEELPKIRKPRRKKSKETESSSITRRLDEFFKS
jgi:type I restriction-modification system DNA methylase subunit